MQLAVPIGRVGIIDVLEAPLKGYEDIAESNTEGKGLHAKGNVIGIVRSAEGNHCLRSMSE